MGNEKIELNERGIYVDGAYRVMLCGSLFYFRMPRAVWHDRIAKLKAAGYNCVDVYFPWNYHERADGSFDFGGERDIAFFLEELKAAGLYVIARPGPYICSEWNGGAIPSRILESGMPIRCADERFLAETERWYRAVLGVIRPYLYPNGSVVLVQLDNELDFFDCPDPEAYISRLAEFAKAAGVNVPLFCCAGQYDVARAGGLTAGVEATMNCYPDSTDASFDAELNEYARKFAAAGKPLLISETNRDHFLLRRELSCGSKLLGAYNQVAGTNFDYNQAVNNWGSPDAMIATEYDFGSMIDAAGGIRAEAEEAALFSAFLRTAGEALASAQPADPVPAQASFRTADGGLRTLALGGGGYAVCAANFCTEGEGDVEFTLCGKTVRGKVPALRAPFFLVGLDLAPRGIPARLTQANCEPVLATQSELVFYAEGEGKVGLDFGSGEEIFTQNGSTHGVNVRFVSRSEALALVAPAVKVAEYTSRPLGGYRKAELPATRKLSAKRGTWFGALGIREGSAEYAVTVPAGLPLFIEHPCDMLRVRSDRKRGETVFADGRDVIVPANGTGRYKVTVEKWGNSNFDDSQSPAIRIACRKGAASFGAVREEQKIGRCDFRLLERYGEETLPPFGKFPVRLSVDKWNSTRKPVVCAYTLPVVRRTGRLILKTSELTDVAVYLDGALLGECDFGTFELTNHLPSGEEHALTLVYRKHKWTQYVGDARLLHIDPVRPRAVRVCTEAEMCAPHASGEEVPLPAKIDGSAAFSVRPGLKGEGYLVFHGKNVKLTCTANGRVIGRLILGWTHAPTLCGGDHTKLYLHPDWEEVYICAEALGKGARLDGAEILTR